MAPTPPSIASLCRLPAVMAGTYLGQRRARRRREALLRDLAAASGRPLAAMLDERAA